MYGAARECRRRARERSHQHNEEAPARRAQSTLRIRWLRTQLESQLKRVPTAPGVYLFRDAAGEVLYVGKAKIAAPARPVVLPGGLERHAPGHPRRWRAASRRSRRSSPRARSRRCTSSRTSSSATGRRSTSGCATTSRSRTSPSRRGRLPARHVHARAPPPRRLVLRPVREREEGARDARRPEPRLPLPAVRRAAARSAQRHPVPRLPHRALPRAVRRVHLEGGLPRADRPGDRVPVGRRPADPAAARAGDARGGGRGAVRGRGALPQPAARDRAAVRAPGRRAHVGRARST